MKLDMNRLEVIDLDDPSLPIQWTGTVDEFTTANVDLPMTDDEREELASKGFVVMGGGAAPMVCVRYATEPQPDFRVLTPDELSRLAGDQVGAD
jgi:hypothetical protein